VIVCGGYKEQGDFFYAAWQDEQEVLAATFFPLMIFNFGMIPINRSQL
jgi:hypothetical protein